MHAISVCGLGLDLCKQPTLHSHILLHITSHHFTSLHITSLTMYNGRGGCGGVGGRVGGGWGGGWGDGGEGGGGWGGG